MVYGRVQDGGEEPIWEGYQGIFVLMWAEHALPYSYEPPYVLTLLPTVGVWMVNVRVFQNPCVACCLVVNLCGQQTVFVALRSENVAAIGQHLPLIIERSFTF